MLLLMRCTNVCVSSVLCFHNNENLPSVALKFRKIIWLLQSLGKLLGCRLLQLTASPRTTETSTRERWQLGAITNRKATGSNRAPSLSSLYDFSVALSLHRDKRITIIRLWWLSQWLVTHGHHLAVTINLHVAPSGRHTTHLTYLSLLGQLFSSRFWC